MKTRKLITLSLMAFALIFTSCDNEEGEDGPAYTGNWETAEFSFGPQTAMMDFTIEEFGFEDDVKIVEQGIGVKVLGVKGTIEPKGGNTLHFELTDLSSAADGFEWHNVDSELDPTFEVIYTSQISAFMPQKFDAEYEISGDRMDLIIPAANDTIVLYKK